MNKTPRHTQFAYLPGTSHPAGSSGPTETTEFANFTNYTYMGMSVNMDLQGVSPKLPVVCITTAKVFFWVKVENAGWQAAKHAHARHLGLSAKPA